MPGPTWGRLYDIAVDQYGFITRDDARDVGVAAQYLTVLAKRGVLEHTGFGLYRFPQVPTTEWTSYMEAVLRVGEGAFLTDDAVLALHELALVNPLRVRVGVPRRVRRDLPGWIEVVKGTAPVELTTYEGIPSTTVAQALRDCIGRVPRDRLVDALEDARQRGLVRRREVPDLAAALEGTPAS